MELPSYRKLKFTFFYIALHQLLHSTTYIEALNLGPSGQSEAYFSGSSSYVRLQSTISLKKQTGLSFRTCSSGSLFSQQSNEDLIELSVNLEGTVFLVRTAGKTYEHRIRGNFCNNKWHTIYLQYQLGNLTIDIDGDTELIANSTYRSEILNSPGLYNEGAAVLLVGNHFNGCLLEGPSIVFDPNISSSFNVIFEPCPIPYDSCTPKEKSTGVDHCRNEPCMRHGTCLSGLNTYTCACLPRYTGKNCEIDLGNPCDRKPPLCKNQATCIPSPIGDYSCICQPDFTGTRCEREIRVHPKCKNNPCLNGGLCDVSLETNEVECKCKPGYGGATCEMNLDECASSPCMNGGVCTDGYNNFTCDCLGTGYKGRICEDNINECLSNPCLNQGTCFDTYGSFMCQCAAGYGGKNCELNVDECLSQPCFNEGECVGVAGGFYCRCPPGFLGEHCEIEQAQQRQCDPNTCPYYADCVNLGNTPRCICKPEHPGDYPNCFFESGCVPNPCKNNGICTPGVLDSYNCTCLPGFAGKHCQKNVDECTSNPCLNGGTCHDLTNGFYCNCTEQWMGAICDKPYDICELNPCKNNGTCTSSPNKRDFTCHCPSGFEGQTCDVNVDDCKDNECPSGQICVDLVNNYECRCPAGYVGDDCSVQLDPCSQAPCNNGTCSVDKVTHQFSCDCFPGFEGTLCDTDIDECKDPQLNKCKNGICVNSIGSFQCYCKPGYTGELCDLDYDECLSMPCRNNASCVNLINKYKCNCPPGYSGDDCSLDINECESNPCMDGATCIDGINDYSCICQPGLTGRRCDVNIDDCESSPCQNEAQCIDGLNSYTCDCSDTGYEGIHCEFNIDDCKGNPCLNGAICEDKIKDYDCNCYGGYVGKNCEIDVNECETSPCQYNGTCLQRSNMTLYNPSITSQFNFVLPESFNRPFNYSDAEGYACLCVPGVMGQNCEININECESNPCHYGTCSDKIGGYVCECEDGYEGDHCEQNIDECANYEPCQNGTCMDLVADYFCSCEAGFGGKNCSVVLTGCMDEPCLNEGQCMPYLIDETEHSFNCTCQNGFHGQTCDQTTTMSLSGNSSVTVNTTREEGYDIQFRFKTTLGDGLLALGKGLTYYILELSKGRLNLHSSLLNKWEGVFIGSNLNDSKWQKVFVAINATHLVLSANDEQTIYPISYNENYNVSSTSFPLTYIGGIPSNLRKLTHSQPFLVGCTEDVLINGEWVLPEVRNAPWLTFQNVDVGCLREPQCNPNPCHSGGHCTDRWRDFSCTCERPYLGHTCQYNYTAATFGYENITDSLVTVDVADYARRAVRSIVDLSMFIRTRQPRGQIFYLGSGTLPNPLDETYIAAQLESGELLVRIQFYGSLESYTVGGVKLNNGYNHLIEVIRNVTLVQVKLNGTEYFRKTISATGTLDAQVLYLGGQPQTRSVRQTNENILVSPSTTKADLPTAPASVILQLSSVNFKGIIQDVQISNGSSVMIVEFYPLQAPDLQIPDAFGSVYFDPLTVKKGVKSDDCCKTNPCLHNGACQNTWNDYRCVCARGFKGKDCNELAFCERDVCPPDSECRNLEDGYECISNSTFDGMQPILTYKHALAPNPTKQVVFDSLEVNFRTRSWGTVLFAKFNEDYFIIFVYHDEVIVEFKLNSKMTTKKFKKDHFWGQWITVYLVYKDDVFKGGFREQVLDENPNFEVTNFDLKSFTEVFKSGEIYVAGSDGKTFDFKAVVESSDAKINGYVSTTNSDILMGNSVESNGDAYDEVLLYSVDRDKKTDNFKGCLGEIRIGGLLLPYFPTKQIYTNQTYVEEMFELTSMSNIEYGCVLCYDTDCQNQGFCIDSNATYKCNCQDGYAADDCSININECENNQCQNNATCVDLVARYECECLQGYEGQYCEIDIDECQSNPCRHGGTCNDLIGTFKCDCPEDFVGKQCEAPLLITCENKPCREGATCKPGPNEVTGNNFTCLCTEGMEGALCDTPFCVKRKCEQGSCNTSEVPFCECQRGFEGKYCEINIDECVLPTGASPCQNGGVCKDGISRYDCDCTETGYTGLLCEMDINECKENKMACGRSGTCENTPGSYRCICDTIKGKCGHQCDLDDPCETIHPCEHGSCISQCTDKPDYVCSCEENYIGKNCTEPKIGASHADGDLNILYYIIPVVLIIVAGFGIGMAILVNIARSKRATRGTYSPSAQEFCNPRVELDHVLKPPPEERLI